MKLLTICSFGKNRSVYLKEHLKTLGYDVESAGLSDDDLKEKVEQSDILIIVHPDIPKQLQEKVDLTDKRVVVLGVEDRPEYVLPEKKPLDGKSWMRFQQTQVYPKLIEQLRTYLPFEE